MPKETFLNLSAEKSDRIIDCAIEEFAEYGFEKASITRIVDRAKIAKGSFYQYFEDKKDIYKYVIYAVSQEKLKYFNDVGGMPEEVKFFEQLHILYAQGMAFAVEHPRYVKIVDDLMTGNPALKDEIIGESDKMAKDFYGKLIEKGIGDGEIRDDIDIKLMVAIIMKLHYSVAELFYETNDSAKDMESYLKISGEMIKILESGIGKLDLWMTGWNPQKFDG